MLKCPNCGYMVRCCATDCPSCGHELELVVGADSRPALTCEPREVTLESWYRAEHPAPIRRQYGEN